MRERVRELAPAIAARLGEDVAFLVQRGTVYFARGTDDRVFSAATTLVQGIYELSMRDAHFALRNTIFTTREPGPFALGMVKVAAKRLHRVEPTATSADLPFAFQEVTYRPPEPPPRIAAADRSHGEWLRFAQELVPETTGGPLHERDRRIGAALVSPEGELLGASANTNGLNRTRHAELNVLSAHWHATHERLRAGTRLYVTLRPCRMCAGLLWELSERPGTVRVLYREDDPGPAARNTVLCPGSEMRRRFARTHEAVEAPGCERVE